MNTENKTKNVYEIVTKQILSRMMKGEIPWRETLLPRKEEKPAFRNRFNGNGYSLLNRLLLGKPGDYATWNQIKEHGGSVKPGAKSKIVTYWCTFIPKDKKDEAEQLEKEGKSIKHLEQQALKFYHVFHMDDVDGIAADTAEQQPVVKEKAQAPTDIAEMVINDYVGNEGLTLEDIQGDLAVYDTIADCIGVPEKDRFIIEEDWYASLFSGMVHSTARENRCDRKTEFEKMTGGEVSPKEELIAEIGSSMILTECGLKRDETHQQIAAICQKWVNAMSRDYRLIVYAASGAEKAAQYILGEFAS